MKPILILFALLCLSGVSHASSKPPLNIVFVGDVLLHQPQHLQALRAENGHKSLWSDIQPIVEQADIAYANLEGPIAPGTVGLGRSVSDPGHVFDKRVYTSYPMFNYHDFLADDLKDSGFDVVSTANNHALDRGSRGVDLTIEHLKRVELLWTGTRSTTILSSFATRVKYNQWVVSFVACTEHTNGIADTNNQVLLCNQTALDVVASEVKDSAVDAVIVTPHWGDEYQTQPNARQRQFAQKLANAGATLIVGSHPHVRQSIELIKSSDNRDVPVLYSLGNFVSNQFHRSETQKGYIAFATLNVKGPPVLKSKTIQMTRGSSYKVVVSEHD